MEKSFKFLDENVEVALATVEDDKPRIRIFQIMKRVNHTLFFATSAKKHVYSQLQINPNVEIMASKGDIFVRVAGKADFSVDEDIQQEIYRTPRYATSVRNYQSLAYFKIEAKK